jgi:hypothetical protein
VHIGDGTVAWGTLGEWVGGIGATLAVLWAVWAFRQDREANERRYAELVAVLPPNWMPSNEQGVLQARVIVVNSGDVPIGLVVVSAELNGDRKWVAQLRNGTHGIAARDGKPNNSKSFFLTWDSQIEDPHLVRPTVIFRDASMRWWSRSLDEPLEKLSRPPRAAEAALREADERAEEERRARRMDAQARVARRRTSDR